MLPSSLLSSILSSSSLFNSSNNIFNSSSINELNNNLFLFNSNKYLNNNSFNLLQTTIQNLNLQLILDQQRQQLNETIKYLIQQGITTKREENFKEKEFKKEEIIYSKNIKKEEINNNLKQLINKQKRRKNLIELNNKLKGNQKRKKRRRQEIETDSPVSGMFIKAFCDEEDLRKTAKAAELQLDDSAAFVNVSEGARKAIALIPDVIGDSRCALCKIKFEDVFRLAMHKCPRIQHEEYKCKECEKVFSCPANLASHRRWHRPKLEEQN